MRSVEKVTLFITRPTPSGDELLLIRHPYAGIQIPAGTVEVGEHPQAAALREAAEETGLTGLTLCRDLGYHDEVLPPDARVVCETTPVYARPDDKSFDWARLPRGLMVATARREADFTHVTYREHDRLDAPRYVSYQITGWVPNAALAQARRRYYSHWIARDCREDTWEIEADGHCWRLFWADLNHLPTIVSPQAQWLNVYARARD